jgi:NlpC/P60 family putative phage cell wall peptidase
MTKPSILTPRQARILAIAEGWIGTPYRHQASLRGVGCDCLGLVRGIWRELYGREPEQAGPYQPDWAEVAGAERLLDAALRHFGPALPNGEGRPGDVLLFRWREGSAARHLGILAPSGRFIHAYERGAVIASPLASAWARRIAFTFRFPEI